MTSLLNYTFATAHVEDGWIAPLGDSVESIDFEAAIWTPSAGVASIAEVAAHASNYLDNLANRLEGKPVIEHEEWPTAPVASEQDWMELKETVRRATERATRAIGAMNDDDLAAEVDGYSLAHRIIDISIHSAYHAGQVVKLSQIHTASKLMAAPSGR